MGYDFVADTFLSIPAQSFSLYAATRKALLNLSYD